MMATGASHAGAASRLIELYVGARKHKIAQLALTLGLAAAVAALAPIPAARPTLAILALTLGAIFLFPPVGRVPGHVWGPILGAAATLALPLAGQLLGFATVSIGAADLGAELLGHLHVPILILAFAYLSISLDEDGVFSWCALRMMRLGAGDGTRLLVAVFLSVSAVTFFTSNDIVILSMTPILIHVGRNAEIRNLTPFLMALFVAANTASMGLYVGNPTNIVIGGAAGLGFLEYARRMVIPTVVATTTALAVVYLVFGRLSRKNCVPAAYSMSRATAPRDDDARWTRPMTIKAAIFGACLVALAVLGNPTAAAVLVGVSHPGELGSGVSMVIAAVSVCFALGAALYDTGRDLRRRPRKESGPSSVIAAWRARLGRMPFEVVPFFLGFCVLLRGIEETGLVGVAGDRIEDAFRAGPILGSLATGVYGVITVNLLNNIPATLLFEKLWLGDASAARVGLEARLDALHPAAADIFVDASLFASNFGANLTFVGALAGLMWLRILRDSKSPGESSRALVSPREFVSYGLIIVPVVTVVTCSAIALGRLALG